MPKPTRATHALREDQKRSTRPQAPQGRGPAPDVATDRLQRLAENPAAASASDVVQLQARYGNRAVQRLLSSHTVQAKLEVGPADDAYEQEADRVAGQVMRMPAEKKDEEEQKG